MNASLRAQLQEQLARFDDDGFAALANRGLLRRAQKDLERLQVTVDEEGTDTLWVNVGAQRVRFDERGVAQARCDCSGTGVCQHILAAALSLQRQGAHAAEDDPLPALRDALLSVPQTAMVQHAGKGGYRWAWQFVHDLDERDALQISGEKHLLLTLQRPRLTFRYMGGGLENLIADAPLAAIERYRVAVLLAFQRTHGSALTPPEATAAARVPGLDMGADHQLAGSGTATIEASRERLRDSARQTFADAVKLGLAHLSSAMLERFTTLAVWAQGAEYHRLSLLLRRIADHVELLLQRAGGADEHRLLDELSLANALVDALAAAAARGLAPAHLVGRARTRYDKTGTLELLGLGARPWRSASGYLGLTMLFWSPKEGFMSCTDARPESLRGFDPFARYRAPGPWSGLGAPQSATGQRLTLVGAQLNEDMRLSALESTSATVLPADAQAWTAERLQPWKSWTALADARGADRSLLARQAPMRDWIFLQPTELGACSFDEARQILHWPLVDAEGQTLLAEVPFDRFSGPAIRYIEGLRGGDNRDDLIVVAQVVARRDGLVASPLSVIRPGGNPPVEPLHFYDMHKAPEDLEPLAATATSQRPSRSTVPGRHAAALREAREVLQRLAERGLPDDGANAWRSALARVVERNRYDGLTAFTALAEVAAAGSYVLRVHYLVMEYELMAADGAEGPL